MLAMPAVSTAQQQSDWRLSAGMGLAYSPDYLGSKDGGFSLRPLVNVSYKGIGFSTQGAVNLNSFSTRATPPGVSFAYSPSEQFRLGVAFRADAGRREDANIALKGLGDVRQTLRANVFLNYRFAEHYVASINVQPDLLGRGGGVSFSAQLGTNRRLTPDWVLVSSIGLTAANQQYMQTQFGITPTQSFSSGLPVYQLGAGLRDVNAAIGLNYRVSNEWTAFGRLTYLQLLGDAGSSPITYSRGQAGAFVGIGYRFF